MLKLLPHRYKTIGAIIAPAGFFLWIAMQFGWIAEISLALGITDPKPINIAIAILGFFSFLFGGFSLTFSKEKTEDEMIKNVRLESFQFAALLQMFFLILGLSWVAFMNPLNENGLMLFFISALFIFWSTYIVRFNYIVHFRIYRYEK